MKRIYAILLSALVATACASSQAGTPSTGSQQSMILSADRITSFSTTLPVEVIIIDSSSPRAVIDIPSAEIAQWVVCELRGSGLAIYTRKGAGHRLDALSADNPIKVRIESSEIGDICNTSSARITCRNKRFATSLSLSNTGALRIISDEIDLDRSFDVSNTGKCALDIKRIKANDKIGFSNTGRIESSVTRFDCRIWDESNTGVIELCSHITAKKVCCTSTGRDRLSLDVDCNSLEVTSTGAGNMTFTGRADNISVMATGSARISTSELHQR